MEEEESYLKIYYRAEFIDLTVVITDIIGNSPEEYFVTIPKSTKNSWLLFVPYNFNQLF